MEGVDVENLTSSIVREYLSRRGCKNALAEMDKEFPRYENSINNGGNLMEDDEKMPSYSPQLNSEKDVNSAVHVKKCYTDLPTHTLESSIVATLGHLKDNDNDLSTNAKVLMRESKVQFINLELEEVNESMDNKPMFMNKTPSIRVTRPSLMKGNKSSSPKPGFRDDPQMKAVLEMLADTDTVCKKRMHAGSYSGASRSVSVMKHKLKSFNKLESDDTREFIFDADIACEIRQLIFGSDKRGFSTEWTDQGFAFNDCEDGRATFLKIGIVQKKGGPCGLLGVVQALVLKNLLYLDESMESPEELFEQVRCQKRTAALEQTLIEIIWKSNVNDKTYLAVRVIQKQFSCPPTYRPDGLTEHVRMIPCTCLRDLQIAVRENIREYERERGGCVLLLYSVILTHTIAQIKSEMDELEGRLLGLHGYCTQEMINLLLHGKATSNAFDNNINLDEKTLLKGVGDKSDIGLLSLFEHYESIKIGENYKSPKYPIWLVCSESHFTVLFSLNEDIKEKVFDLYYYDGLANQDEVIRLTINLNKQCSETELFGSLVPPLEHCIRTKWPNASISWNDTDPIL